MGGDRDRLIEAAEAVSVSSGGLRISDREEDSAEQKREEGLITFSHTETFYNHDISVELFTENPDAEIYYSINGATPGVETVITRPNDRTMTEKPQLYSTPIRIRAGDRTRATTVKAVAVVDGEFSEVITKSYVTGKNVFDRFSPDTFVFVLSTDPYNLYDHYDGIYVDGFYREEYIEAGGVIQNPTYPANFNLRGRGSERPMYVEVFNSDGEILLKQAAGTRIVGGWSRGEVQKSLRLIARREYSKGKFSFPFFTDSFNNNGQLITRFDRLTLRNGGNDRNEAALRDELIQRLARQAGFPDAQSFAPAAVFLNSEYYGFAWLKEYYDSGHLEQKYGGAKEKYQLIQNSERVISTEDTLEKLYARNIDGRSRTQYVKVNETGEIYKLTGMIVDPKWEPVDGLELKAHEDWHYVYRLAENGLTDDAAFDEFCALVDIDNLMLYYAIQIYIDNRDWPGNNIRMWKYYADKDEFIANPFNDGRWRFQMYDVDFGFGLYGSSHAGRNTLSAVLGKGGNHMGGQSELLKALLEREDMQEKFINTVSDLKNNAFSAENAESVMKDIIAMSQSELTAAMDGMTLAFWASQYTFDEKREQIVDFVRERPEAVDGHIRRVFDIPDDVGTFSVSLTGTDGSYASLNTLRISGAQSVEGSYYECFEIPLKAEPYAGYEFMNWEINGKIFTEPEMKISAALADSSGKVSITLHTNKLIDGQPLYVSAVDAGSKADWIELVNPNSVSISTKDYFLSDDFGNMRKWKIPPVNIPPQGTLTIVMNNNRTAESLMKLQTNFSLSEGETLYLSDMSGTVIAAVEIPRLRKGEILRRKENGDYIIVNE
jgi:hypothetical protein